MYQNCCKKCGSTDLFTKEKGNNIGLYCSDWRKTIKKIDRTGIEKVNIQGCRMKIIEYVNSKEMKVQFLDDYKAVVKAQWKEFNNGHLLNPYFPTIYGVGIVGGKNKRYEFQYEYWKNILLRCYGATVKEKHHTYQGCTICEEWLLYENFKKWCDENYYQIENERMQIDKDILFKKNKHYSPNTCCFVPDRINCLIIKSDKIRGEYPIGVSYRKKSGLYTASMKKKNRNVWLGDYATPEEAFQAYKIEKEKYIKEVADLYKGKIPKKLYDALYKYQVEIDD